MVLLLNESTGSDAETFSHLFKKEMLGPAVGVRTWGGLIGVIGRDLSDNATARQPELALCFLDRVGCGIENYGVEPDDGLEVDYAPQDAACGVDAQLARACAEAMRQVNLRRAGLPVDDPRLPREDTGDQRRAG
jgi:tricorn protease